MNYKVIETNIDVSYLREELFDERKHLIVKPASFYKNIPQDHLSMFCHFHGIYCLPTIELINWLQNHVIVDKTIEIGAGIGTIGRTLGIPITDSCYMKSNPTVATFYKMMGQPITEYPNDVIELDSTEAIKKYKPEVVIGSWITHKFNEKEAWREGNQFGVDENFILANVKKYIMIGNQKVHEKKPIFSIPYKTFSYDWLYSRSVTPELNAIFLWENL
jgi:hypothetical protein